MNTFSRCTKFARHCPIYSGLTRVELRFSFPIVSFFILVLNDFLIFILVGYEIIYKITGEYEMLQEFYFSYYVSRTVAFKYKI